ncbi:hypothetical protein LUZ60_000321 [Juncus effusus]|nr:hypothetical protein LUZ60_000321 [Juncus effusus]
MPSQKGSKKFIRFLHAPVRCLCWARDFYVRSLNECAGQMPYEASLGCPVFGHTDHFYSLRSNWSNASGDDMAELIRAATEEKLLVKKSGSNMTVPRSHSVAIGRIDEDKPCEFKDCDFKAGSSLIFTRSCSASGHSGQVGSRRNHVSFV